MLLEAIGILEDNGSVKYSAEKAAQMVEEAWRELSPVIPEGKPKSNIEALSRFLIDRTL